MKIKVILLLIKSTSNLVLILTLYSGFFSPEIKGQTCCTGAAPITESINVVTSAKNVLNFNIIFDYNKIADFYQNNKRLKDNYIMRNTSTLFLKGNYGVSNKISVAILIPYVKQTEIIKASQTSKRNASFGDVTIFSQYKIFKSKKIEFHTGLGVKLPTGTTKTKNKTTQFVLQPTLQVGTGSFDFIFYSQAKMTFPFRKSITIEQLIVYKLNGNSSNYASHKRYKFGNDIQSITSLNDQILLGKIIHSPSILLRIRKSQRNEIEAFIDSNSGGIWMYLSPGWTAHLSQQISISALFELPILRHLNGFQLTTSFKFITSLNIQLPSNYENKKKRS